MAKLLLSVAEAADELGIDRKRAYVWVQLGILPGVRDRGRIFIARRAVERLADQIAEGDWPDRRVTAG